MIDVPAATELWESTGREAVKTFGEQYGFTRQETLLWLAIAREPVPAPTPTLLERLRAILGRGR